MVLTLVHLLGQLDSKVLEEAISTGMRMQVFCTCHTFVQTDDRC
jgi:hypothetical protein